MSYEQEVMKRKAENREFLRSLRNTQYEELTSFDKAFQNGNTKTPKKPRRTSSSSVKSENTVSIPRRKSARLKGIPANYADLDEIEDDNNENASVTVKFKRENSLPVKIKRENSFGAIPDVPIGAFYSTRLEASHAGIHRPTVAGIHGNPDLGCYSIALSGGYEDDVDLGDSFMYTGEGGRDLKGTKANPKNLRTAAQSKDQQLVRGNLALSKNVENNLPVRVLRGYKLNSEYAPEEGYRYDGLYKVVEYFLATGKSGFAVYKFRFERMKDQDPAPWK